MWHFCNCLVFVPQTHKYPCQRVSRWHLVVFFYCRRLFLSLSHFAFWRKFPSLGIRAESRQEGTSFWKKWKVKPTELRTKDELATDTIRQLSVLNNWQIKIFGWWSLKNMSGLSPLALFCRQAGRTNFTWEEINEAHISDWFLDF